MSGPVPVVTSSPGGPSFPLAVRLERRARVEELMLAAVSQVRVERQVAEEFRCSPVTVRNDCRRVRRKWQLEDTRASHLRRARVVRNLEATVAEARAAGNHGAAVAGLVALAKIVGLIRPDGFAVQVGVQVGTESLKALMVQAAELEQAERIRPAELVQPAALESQQAAEGGKPNDS